MGRRPFRYSDMQTFRFILDDCLKASGQTGGTLHQFMPRLTVGGPAKGLRYGMRPIVQVYLDGKPLERAWSHCYLSDLEA